MDVTIVAQFFKKMKSSWRIARFAGVDINVHWSFSLVILAVALQGAAAQKELLNIALILVALLLLFGCVVLHELGHALMALWLRVEVRSITLLPVGGLAQIQAVPGKPGYEFLITAAGPLANLILALAVVPLLVTRDERLFLAFLTSPQGMMETIFYTPFASGIGTGLLIFLLLTNVILFVFNLIPAFPMDGGRMLRAGLALFLSYGRATQIAVGIGQLLALLLLLGAFWFPSPALLFMGLFVFVAGRPAAFKPRPRREPLPEEQKKGV